MFKSYMIKPFSIDLFDYVPPKSLNLVYNEKTQELT